MPNTIGPRQDYSFGTLQHSERRLVRRVVVLGRVVIVELNKRTSAFEVIWKRRAYLDQAVDVQIQVLGNLRQTTTFGGKRVAI